MVLLVLRGSKLFGCEMLNTKRCVTVSCSRQKEADRTTRIQLQFQKSLKTVLLKGFKKVRKWRFGQGTRQNNVFRMILDVPVSSFWNESKTALKWFRIRSWIEKLSTINKVLHGWSVAAETVTFFVIKCFSNKLSKRFQRPSFKSIS